MGLARGPVHEYMHAALAAALGLARDEFDARLSSGETPWSIGVAQGLGEDEVAALLAAARAEALAAAVADGVITQEQADWMLAHPMGLGAERAPGDCPMHPAPADAPAPVTQG
jgi:hypothetical protein